MLGISWSDSAKPSSRWKGYTAFGLTGLINGFGSSTPDTTVSRSEITTIYVHPTLGSDSNDGSSHLLAKATLPQAPSTTDIKYLVASGSTVTLTAAFDPSGARMTLSVYDSDIRSNTYGQEIVNHPNPFNRSTAGGWVTLSEMNSKYFILQRPYDPSTVSLTTTCVANRFGTNLLVRGAILKGSANCVYINGASSTTRIEDCVLIGASLPPIPRADHRGGASIRVDSTPPTIAPSIARCFISEVGEDAIHSVYTTNSTPIISDCAIDHRCKFVAYGSQHTDVIQLGATPGNFIIKRTVIQHVVEEHVIPAGDGISTGIGGVLVSTGVGTATPGGIMIDCIIASTQQLINIETQPGVSMTRVLGLMIPCSSRRNEAIVNWQQPGIETDCVWAIMNSSKGGYLRWEPNGQSTKTRVIDISAYTP